MSSKLASLADAVREHVEPGEHLNFASTPVRSNAAVREIARAFRGKNPGFVLSATGFHSTAHVLGKLRLGRRYIGCFFGDNYPVPRPNDLYTELLREGAEYQLWSVWTYVSALRAGALGLPYSVTNSLAGTTMARELAAAGMYHEVASPSAAGSDRGPSVGTIGLISPMRSDITFVHALMGDADGNLVFGAPHGEGFWGAIGARRGVIATVEQVVAPHVCAAHPDALKIPAHHVLAVCESPFGAHPQALYAQPRFGVAGYPDDFDHYELWRAMTMAHGSAEFERFTRLVLTPNDGEAGYREFVSEQRLERLLAAKRNIPPASALVPRSPSAQPPPLDPHVLQNGDVPDAQIRANEIHIVLAARKIVERVRERRFPTILAGVGQGFLAVRLARLWLRDAGIEVKVIVELGLFDLECGTAANEFLLAYDNIEQSRRLSSVEDVLGTIACGADNGCLAVIGAAQVDTTGAVNSTRLKSGRFLVGSGGGNDVASSSSEVLVLARCSQSRLVQQVDYVTSPGHRVQNVVTDRCCFTRSSRASSEAPSWTITDLYPALGGRPVADALAAVRENCDWPFETGPTVDYAPAISTAEIRAIHTLDPNGIHWRRGQ